MSVTDQPGSSSMIGNVLVIDPRAAVRPEAFGALAYHFDTRRLVFLKDALLVRVVEALDGNRTVGAALDVCGIPSERRNSFVAAIDRLVEAGVLCSPVPDASATGITEPDVGGSTVGGA